MTIDPFKNPSFDESPNSSRSEKHEAIQNLLDKHLAERAVKRYNSNKTLLAAKNKSLEVDNTERTKKTLLAANLHASQEESKETLELHFRDRPSEHLLGLKKRSVNTQNNAQFEC